MTSHACSYESVSSRGHTGPGLPIQNQTGISLPGTGWATVNNRSNAINHPLVPFSGFHPLIPPIHRVWFRTITDTAATISIGNGVTENTVVSIDGTSLDNDTALIISTSGFASGRLAPDIILDFNGDAATALAALTGTTIGLDVNVEAGYIHETYMGMQQFCEFQEQPPNTGGSGHERLNELLNLFEVSSARFQIGVDTNGAAVFVEQAGFAALDPSAVIYIRPEDIGPNALQIPADMTDNSAAAFRAHPSVFYPSGKSQYVRAITRQGIDSEDVAAATTQPIKIISVTAAPTSSLWLVTIDGAPMIVRVSHPTGSDLRRPRDIWESAILPIINQGGANQGAETYTQIGNGLGDAVLSRLTYADYWRCLPLPGTRITQTGGGG